MRKKFFALSALILLPLGIWQKTRLEVIFQDISVFFQSVVFSHVSTFLQNVFASVQLVNVSTAQLFYLFVGISLVLGLIFLRARRKFDDSPRW